MFSTLPPINLLSYKTLFFNMQPKDKVNTKQYMGFEHSNCEFFPCHIIDSKKYKGSFNCLFCYCPLIPYKCKGNYTLFTLNGVTRKDCTNCYYNHNGIESSWKWIQPQLNKPELL